MPSRCCPTASRCQGPEWLRARRLPHRQGLHARFWTREAVLGADAAKSCGLMSSPERGSEIIAAAARTLARMRTYIKTALPPPERGTVFHTLARLPIERLAAMNPVEAEHEVEHVMRAVRQTQHDESQIISLTCASRASALAMTQTRAVAAKLAQHGIATDILNVTTTGDRVQDRALVAIGAESLFVKELELALRDRRAQYAVHSCKDLPSTLVHDMTIAAISVRE